MKYFSLSHTINGREIHATLSIAQLVKLAQVSQKTAQRWIDGTQTPHPHSIELLKIKVFGLLPGDAFQDYYVARGCLITPTGEQIEPRDLDVHVWLRGLYYRGLEDIKRERKELQHLLERLPLAERLKRARS